MSEFPFGSPAGDHMDAESDSGSRDRKTILVAGALAAVVLGAGGYFILGSGGGSDSVSSASAVTHPARTKTTSTTRTPAGSAAKPGVVPAVATVEPGRNPFKALYIPAAKKTANKGSTVVGTSASGSVVDPASVPTTSDVSGPGGSTSPVFVAPTAPTTPVVQVTTPARPSTPAPAQHALTFLRPKAGGVVTGLFRVDGKYYEVAVGKVFGPSNEIQLVALQQGSSDSWTAVLRVGDSSPFDALQGKQVSVR